ncbi:MAG: hydrogenobyrinic acid a,c-diamide synthase (glutamine-hydrolyzing) [Deltaproteobacteria bacterium]|nr:hydrogenobyrinic acid a,c-diamide synthase (glutamine-hydrolyzing) [Deltaproteobacteria bacterium]
MKNQEHRPRILISAPHRSSGKSTISIGLSAAFRERGVSVQPFKKGPDYIDPMWLTRAAGRECRNLDFFMMGEESIRRTFAAAGRDAGLSLIEGNMGFFDGLDLEGTDSTAALARLLRVPAILVVNTRRMTRGIAPLVLGHQQFEPGTPVAGVILNRIRGARHEKKLREALVRYSGIEVVGAIPDDQGLLIEERHLGLTPVKENLSLPPVVEKLSGAVSAHVDLDRVLEIARSAPEIAGEKEEPDFFPEPDVRIGVAMDPAFTFYYPENLSALRRAGAGLVPFNTLKDHTLPDVNALYIGGGFPEVFMEALEKNSLLRGAIREAVEEGLPVYAECGGLMYLTRSITYRGEKRAMVGVLPCDVEMHERPMGHGYVILETTGKASWLTPRKAVHAHEFHHSKVVNLGKVDFAYRMVRGRGVAGRLDGILHKNVLAAYTHLHAGGDPRWAVEFCAFVRETGFALPPGH